MNNYEKAKELGLTNINRWEEGLPHHPKSKELMEFMAEHDDKDYGYMFDWGFGGDDDIGETIMYQMDAFFEMKDTENG